QAESIPGELRLRDEGGQAREQEDRDRPRGETRKQHGVADELNAVLSEAEGARDQAQRPARGLAPGACQLVIELGVLEVAQLEGKGLLEDHLVDALAELHAQEGLGERQAALRSSDGSHED